MAKKSATEKTTDYAANVQMLDAYFEAFQVFTAQQFRLEQAMSQKAYDRAEKARFIIDLLQDQMINTLGEELQKLAAEAREAARACEDRKHRKRKPEKPGQKTSNVGVLAKVSGKQPARAAAMAA